MELLEIKCKVYIKWISLNGITYRQVSSCRRKDQWKIHRALLIFRPISSGLKWVIGAPEDGDKKNI